MRVRHCSRIYRIIPDALGLRVDLIRVPRDWTLTGYVGRTIGRVWRKPGNPQCLRCDGYLLQGEPIMFCTKCTRELLDGRTGTVE